MLVWQNSTILMKQINIIGFYRDGLMLTFGTGLSFCRQMARQSPIQNKQKTFDRRNNQIKQNSKLVGASR